MTRQIRTWAAAVALFCLALTATISPASGSLGFASPATAQTPTVNLADYRMGAGDKIRLIVFGEDALSGEFFVSGGGKVSLPLIGEIQASGLTVSAFQDEVRTALMEGYLKDPRVSAEILNYRPFYILGEVDKPGEYPYTNNLSVLNAVATAGGFTYRANKKRVFIKRSGETDEQSQALSPEVRVLPGDTIRIGERLF
jgi:polysaccharide export outer membrane protein